MNMKKEWPIALRHGWLTGGIVAVNEPESDLVEIRTHVMGDSLANFKISSYGALFPNLQSLGFKVIGACFVTDAKQLEGKRAPEFRCAGSFNDWPVWDVLTKWRQIASGSSRQDAMQLLDSASRIASGLEYSELRLYDLAMSYSAQLHSHYDPRETKESQYFEDTVSPSVYKDIHALFWEMAVLRDALAEFVAVFCLSREGVTTLSGLRKSLNQHPSDDPFAEEVMIVSSKDSPGGWLFWFGAYRDCFTHSAPLQQASGMAFAVQDHLTLKDGGAVPQIYFSLPQDPDYLSRRRSKGVLFSSFRDMALAASTPPDRSIQPDALEYLHNCLCRLTDLAGRLVQRSPIAPTQILITQEDIIGELRITPERG